MKENEELLPWTWWKKEKSLLYYRIILFKTFNSEIWLLVNPNACLPGRNCLLLSSTLYLLKPTLLSSLITVSGYKKLLAA
jgi:hypothetical protein